LAGHHAITQLHSVYEDKQKIHLVLTVCEWGLWDILHCAGQAGVNALDASSLCPWQGGSSSGLNL